MTSSVFRLPRFALFVAVTLVLITACGSPLENRDTGITGQTPVETEVRAWRLVFLFLDRNDLAPVAGDAIDTIAAFPDRYGNVHRIVVRDSTYGGSSVTLAAGGGTRAVELPALPAGSLLEGDTTATLLSVLRQEFPAENQALFLVGHGRGWSGIGFSDDDPRLQLTVTELRDTAGALRNPDASEGCNLLVIDAGWSAFAELIYELHDLPIDLIVPGTNLDRNGMDYGAMLATLDSGDWSARSMLDAVQYEMTRAGNGVAAVVLEQEKLTRFGPFLNRIVGDAVSVLTSVQDQDRIRSYLMEHAVATTTPGDAHITVGDLVDEPTIGSVAGRDATYDGILLHITTVDELGLPSGHAAPYRATDPPRSSPFFFHDIEWAPDFFRRSGFLFELWYREY